MEAAIDEHPKLINDEEATKLLKLYFQYTAHYIVAALTFMRPDQVRNKNVYHIWTKTHRKRILLPRRDISKAINSNSFDSSKNPHNINPWMQLSGGTSIDSGRIW